MHSETKDNFYTYAFQVAIPKVKMKIQSQKLFYLKHFRQNSLLMIKHIHERPKNNISMTFKTFSSAFLMVDVKLSYQFFLWP